ncbi:MAG TPA: FecR domain-containing protein, partial [Anseongella sp.]|nr:FecR domain-containing protein [Anseongella sp.]
MEKEAHLKSLLRKYISGQCSPEETEQVFAWLKTPKGIRQLTNIMDTEAEDVFSFSPEMNPGISDEIYTRLRGRMQAPEHRAARLFGIPKKWRIAAALAGFLALTAAGYKVAESYNTITYTTDYAQKEVIILPDHSTVTLNGNSRLSFSRNWDKKPVREVELEGEAFFEVVKNESKPFTVITSEIGINVLGTSFNVKSYEEEETIETTLVKGKVAIRNLDEQASGEGIVLKPNQKATYSKKSANLVLDVVRTELYTSWKSG